MITLKTSALDSLRVPVITPAYSPGEHQSSIVHVGTGAFHRAHQAVYTDTALGSAGGDWRIVGSSLRSRTTSDQLNHQDGLYTVVARDVDAEEVRVVGAIERVIFAPEQPRELIDAIGSPRTRIVTLTVTEKGYCYDPAAKALDESNALVAADIGNIDAPQSAPGYIVAGLRARRDIDAGPMTVLSCDNLPDNGNVTRRVVMQLADAVEPDLARWIEGNVTFPSSMVDRITPATTDADRRHVESALGMVDECPVMTESFSQWVIEDHFAAGRPSWEDGGATLVGDVAPFEKMKLRLLNGSHSTIAYLGCVAGYEFVHEVIAEPTLRALVRTMMDREITPTLDALDFDLGDYKDRLIRRFANASLNHATRQIAMDGSQKLPQRLLAPIRERLAAGQAIDCMVLAVAAWMRYVGGADESGAMPEVDDPLASQFEAIRQRHAGDPASLAQSLLAIRPIFGDELPEHPEFGQRVATTLAQLFTDGVETTVKATLAGTTGNPSR